MPEKKIRIPSILLTIFFVLFINFHSRAEQKVNGSLETTGYFYRSESSSIYQTDLSYRAYENLNLDVDFTDNTRFHTNGRVMYRSNKNESPKQWEYNLYYGYIDLDITRSFNIQAGRIIDIKNLLYTCYDGANFQYSAKVYKSTIILAAYGGLVVSDKYLDEEDKQGDFINPTVAYILYPPKYVNSFDVRNITAKERKGDSIGGGRASFQSDGIGIFNMEYLAIFNNSQLAEHYASADFETFFSKTLHFYGYGTFDLVENSPANTLLAARINPSNILSIEVAHEYSRPVFMKNSFWRIYFGRYSTQEAMATLIYIISPKMTTDLKYGWLHFDATKQQGNDIAANLEHRDIFKFRLRMGSDYINGPEGELLNLKSSLSRRINIFDILAGGGMSFYDNDMNYFNNFSKGYFAVLGLDTNIFKNLIISANGEYYSDPTYKYNIKGLLSVKYLF